MPTVPKECLIAKEDGLGPKITMLINLYSTIGKGYNITIVIYLIARGLGRLGTSFYLL